MAEIRELGATGPCSIALPGASPRANLISQLTRAFAETVEIKRRLKMKPLPASVDVPFKVVNKKASSEDKRAAFKQIFGITAGIADKDSVSA